MQPSKKHINFAIIDEELQENSNPIETIVRNIKSYSQQNGNLLQKYDEQFYLAYFDRNVIQQTLIKLGSDQKQKKELKLQQFIQNFLGFIEHKQEQTLFLAMSLRNLFIKIKENTSNQNGVKFSDFTNFLCQRIAKQNPDLIVPLKQVPHEKIVPDVKRIRQIDINPPIILKNGECDLPRIAKQKKKKDKKLVERKPVSKFVFNQATNQIITMGRLSSCIHFYDMELKKQHTQIYPKTYRDMTREIAILSMDFDEVNQRIGAIINGIGIAFWQASDNFDTQKTISKYQGQKIFYLRLFKEWVTTDKNTVYFWDLKEQTISKKITNEEATIVNDVCQINHLRCVCVSYTTRDDKKPFIVYKNEKPIAKYEMGSSGCHSLHYNIPSQMIITAGYHNMLEVFEVENKTYSINLKKELKGHASIVTCVSDIKNTNFILSGDDSGEVRIWELNFMKCIQVVKVSKYINDLYCTGEKLIFSDSRLNTMQMDKFSLPYINDEEIIHHFFQEQTQIQIVITRKSFRRINFNNGRIEMIFVVCDEEEEISSAIKISSGILIGTSKGFMKLFTTEGKIKWQILAHQGQITQIKYDRKARFIFSLGTDSKLMIWPQKTILEDGVKKIITFKNSNFNLMSLFNEVRLMFLASTQESDICVWDYENLKLLTVIKLNSPVLFMDINHLYRVLMVSTIYDEFCFFKLVWKSGNLDYEIIYNGDSSFSGLRKAKKTNHRMSVEQDSSLKNLQNLENNLRLSKKEKSKIQTPSRCNIAEKNNNKGQFFVTSTKIPNERSQQPNNLKKSGLKNSSVNIQMNQQIQCQYVGIPSIKLIQKQSLVAQTQQTLGTLKTLKKIDNEITTRMEIKETQEFTLLLIGNSKGQISCFNISCLIKELFSDYETPLKKNESPHMYRPAKQDYDSQISKHKFSSLTLQSISNISKVKKSYFKLFWKQNCPNRQPISCLSFIQMKKIYMCVSMTDGCCKYIDLQTGLLKGNLKMNLPLPINWDIEIEKDLYIRRNLYETLLVLDDILSNHGFQMLAKEYKAINVTKFLQMLRKTKCLKQKGASRKNIQASRLSQNGKKITLLHEEYSVDDMKNISHGIKDLSNNENTLKSLEAYKRVKQIKQKMNLQIRGSLEQNTDDGIQRVSTEVLRQKEEIQKVLAPNYFSVLGEYGASTRLNKSVEIGSLEQRSHMLLEKINKNKSQLHNLNQSPKPCQNRLKRQSSLLPTLPTIRSRIAELKNSEQDTIKQNSLVGKLTNSLSTMIGGSRQQRHTELVSIYSNSTANSIIKNLSSVSGNNSKLTQSTKPYQLKVLTTSSFEEKQNLTCSMSKLQGLAKKQSVEDKTTREILNQINEKLHKYKKSNYSKREII